MAMSTFESRWDFLYATVLVGVNPETGVLYARPQPGTDEPLLCLWTDVDAARAALPAPYVVTSTPVRPRLAELPEGVGLVIDPDSDGSTVIDPAYAQRLRPFADAFPTGSQLVFALWTDLPKAVRTALVDGASRYAFVEHVWALQYRIDDSPWIGCLAYDTAAGSEGQDSIADALLAPLDQTEGPAALGVLGVQVMSLRDLQDDVRDAVREQPALYSAAP